MLMPELKGLVIDEGYADFFRPVHPSKALSPMEVTEGGITTEANSVALAKADWPIEVTEFGIIS